MYLEWNQVFKAFLLVFHSILDRIFLWILMWQKIQCFPQLLLNVLETAQW